MSKTKNHGPPSRINEGAKNPTVTASLSCSRSADRSKGSMVSAQSKSAVNNFRFSSWNVGTMTGRSLEVVDELWKRKVDICGVQETRWKGANTRFIGMKGRRYKFWWQGGDTGTGGVGIMMKEDLSKNVIEVKRKSDRLIVVTLVMGKLVVKVICAYAPQQGRPDEEKEIFYDSLEEELRLVGSDEFLIVCGDWNGHIGENPDGYEGVHGGYGFGIRNEEGCRLLEMCDANNLIVANTCFKKEIRKRITYKSGLNESMIDLFLIKDTNRKYVTNVKVIRQETQHGLVLLDLSHSRILKRKKDKFIPKTKLWKLRSGEERECFERVLAEKWDSEEDGEVWTRYKDCALKTAEEICGKTKGKCRHGETWWWKDEVRLKTDEKKLAFKAKLALDCEWTRGEYEIAKRDAKVAVAKARQEANNEIIRECQERKKSGLLYKIARQSKRDKRDVGELTCIRDDEGKLCLNEDDIAEVWKKHMEGVMNVENDWDGLIDASVVEGPIRRFEREEIKEALNDLRCGKAGGVSGIVAEHLQASPIAIDVLTQIGNNMLNGDSMPVEWRSSVLVPLYKGKGDVRECGSYRGVKLLEHGMKVIERVIERRLRSTIEINEMQCGFMPGKGTVDALFIVRMLQEKYAKKKKKLYMCFVDLEKAFDRVPRKVIEWSLRKKGVEERLVKVIMNMYLEAKTKVRVGSTLSSAFDVGVGVHQGSILSPFLFAIVMDVVCGSAMEGLLYEILYADDLVLMADSMIELQAKYSKWKEALERKGLKVNVAKTKCMISGDSDKGETSRIDPCGVCGKRVGCNSILCKGCNLWVHRKCSGIKGQLYKVAGTFRCKTCVQDQIINDVVVENMSNDIEKVNNFVYLGDCLSSEGGCRKAIVMRVRAGWKKFRDLSGLLCGKKFSLKMKGTVYSTCVRTVMTYGGETWTAKKEDEAILLRAERRMIRMMCGVKLLDKRRSEDLRSMMGIKFDIVDIIRKSRLRWFGHVMRREKGVGIRKVLEIDIEGKVDRGRPKLMWNDIVKKDMKQYKIDGNDCLDRKKWKLKVSRIGTKSLTTVNGDKGRFK